MTALFGANAKLALPLAVQVAFGGPARVSGVARGMPTALVIEARIRTIPRRAELLGR